MTPQEIYDACQDFKKRVGPKAWMHISISQHGARDEPVFASIYPFGAAHSDAALSTHASDWGDALQKLADLWEEASERLNAKVLHKMALAIINVTASHGSCTEAGLRMEGFDQSDIDRFGAAACDKANEMADLGPFTITALSGANAA